MTTQFYRGKDQRTGKEVLRETGTDRYIGPIEFGSGAGFTEQKQEPQRKTTRSPLGKFQSNLKFVNILKDAIKRKQGMNRDIQSSRDYWRTQQRDPMTFTDKRLRLLSPAQQQSLREKRYATAGAKLQGLREEEAYRGSRMDDIVKSVTDAQQAELADAKEARLKLSSDISNLRSLDGTGYTVDPNGNLQKDYSGATAKQIAQAMKAVESGGDYGDAGESGETGAYQYTKGTWDQYSSEYARDVLKESRANLPMTPKNQDKVTEYKIQKWIDGGYSPQQIASMWNAGKDKPNAYAENWRGINDYGVTYDTPRHVEKVMNALGQIYQGPSRVSHETWTASKAEDLASKTGLSSTDLWNNYTDAELDALKREVTTDITAEAVRDIEPATLRKYGFKNREEVEQLLTLKYDLGASEEELVALAEELGIKVKLDSPLSNGDGEVEPFTITEILDKITNK